MGPKRLRMYQNILLFLLCTTAILANPFLISPPPREELSEIEFFEQIQQELRTKNIGPLLDLSYPSSPPKKKFLFWGSVLASKQDFYNRISKAFHQTLIDQEHQKLPITCLVKIGKGGDRCLVSYATFNGKYAGFLEHLPQTLEQVGFNGFLFYRVGGFPNPTGEEVRFAGVPYSFKIFSLLEAEKLGFSKVLWIDSAFVPLRDPSPLFSWLEQEGSFVRLCQSPAKYLLPKTRDILLQETGVDVLESSYVSAQVIGFDLTKPHVQAFIQEYYRLLELGTPFFSCFPEEYVFSAIAGKDPILWKPQPFELLVFPEIKLRGKDPSWPQQKGYFFLQKDH